MANAVANEESALVRVAALIATVLAIAYAGLSPFEFRPANRARWLDGRPGLRLSRDAVAFTKSDLDWPPDSDSLSIELWLQPDEEPRSRLARIFALFDDQDLPQLSIDQWGSVLIVRDRLQNADGSTRYREHGARDALRAGRTHHLVITSGPQGTRAYVDGEPTSLSSQLSVIAEGEQFAGRLVVGNSIRGTQQWSGELYGLAIHARELPAEVVAGRPKDLARRGVSSLQGEPGLLALYPLDDRDRRARNHVPASPDLELPAEFKPLRRTLLHWPGASDHRSARFREDLAVNIVGFLPLGFLIAYVVRRRGETRAGVLLVTAVASAAALSLAIEVTQAHIPSRVSSLTDVVANTLGGALGWALEWLWAARAARDRT